MTSFPSAQAKPLQLATNVESQVYLLFAVAMGLTVAGVYAGMIYAPLLLQSGVVFGLVILELALILTSQWWVRQSPLNLLLFGIFPLISGVTITPLLLSLLQGYANGATILLNALAATGCMAAASAILAKLSGWNLSGMGRALLFSLLGLIALSIIQIFVPGLQTGGMELFISGAGVVIFGLFTAYDLQRVGNMARMGVSPFILALSLYLDIFNLFIYILRFMIALSGDRR